MEQLSPDRTTGFAMIEPLLCGIVLGLIPVTLLGLFVAAWSQYRRGSMLDS
jgi:cytochrome b6-f complex subunit 5